MRSSLLLATLGWLIGASALHAQTTSLPTGTAFELTPYAGYMIFGSYLKGPLGTDLTNSPGVLYGAQLGMELAPNVALVGNLGYTSSNLQVGIPLLGGYSVGSSTMLIYDGDLQLDLPLTTASGFSISPFVQAGVGAIHYNIDESILQTQATNFAANAGVGADFSLGRTVGLRFMAKDYIGKFDFKQATSLDIQGETAHNWALSAGLRLNF